MTLAMGIDLGRERDNTVLVLAERLDPEGVVTFIGVRVLSRVPFSEEPGGQYDIMRKNILAFPPDIVVVDSTGMTGKPTTDWLRENVDAFIWDYSFGGTGKSELLGVAKEYFTAGLLEASTKYRQVLIEFSNIRRKIGPSGVPNFYDEPHGDMAWAAALALWGVNKVDGDVGVGDFGSILKDSRRPSDANPFLDIPPRKPPLPKGTMEGQYADGMPYLIKLPSEVCKDCGRRFPDTESLEYHRKVDHEQDEE